MSLKDRYNFEYLINESERIVMEQLEKQLQDETFMNVCKCQDCVLDMAALSLNSVKPLYRVSLIGNLYAHTLDESDYSKEIQQAVTAAVKKISDNPAHD